MKSILRRRLPLLLTSVACALAYAASSSHAGSVSFDGNGVSSNVLSTPANWSTNVLPSGTDQAIFTDAAFGGPLFSTGTNSTAQTWGNLTWNSNVSATINGSAITLTGSGGTPDIITVGPLMTSGTLTYSFNGLTVTATNAVVNVVNAGATLNMTTQFEFNNTLSNQVVTKTGAGTWNFNNGNNGNAGAGPGSKFVLDQGTINVPASNGNMFGGSNLTVFEIHDGTFLDTAGASFGVVSSKNYTQIWAGDFTYKGSAQSLNLGTGTVSMTGSRQITVANSTLTVAGVIGDGGNAYGLTKAGPGTLALTAASTYTGDTVINSGTLRLLFASAGSPTSNIVNSSSALKLAGGSLLVTGTAGATNSQTFASTTVRAGSSLLSGVIGTGGTVNIALGAISRQTGGLLNFTLPATGAISTTSSNDANGLLGAGLTVGLNDWATVSGGNIVAFTGYTTQNGANLWTANQNITTTAAVTGSLGGALTLNSLRYNANAVSNTNLGGQTLTVLDGIMMTSAVSSSGTISNGSIRGSAGGDLVVINNNNSFSAGSTLLTISANVVDNTSATAFTKGGNKTVVLSGSNTYTGATYVNSSTLQAGSANPAFGNNSAVVISTNAALNLNNFNQSIGSLASNTPTGTGLVTLGTGTLTMGGANTSTNFSGSIAGTGGVVKVGSGTQTLSGANTYTGLTRVSVGTLLVNGSIASGGSVIVDNGGKLGGSGTVGSLVTTAGVTSVISPGNSPGTLTLSGGLDASAGANFVFELGTTSDLLSLGSGVLTGSTNPNSLVFDFFNSGGLLTGTTYTLVTFGSSSGLDYTDLTANTLPSGFTLNSGFGTNGFLINGSSLQVQFATIPEPSTAVMLGLGLGCTLWNLRRKRRA